MHQFDMAFMTTALASGMGSTVAIGTAAAAAGAVGVGVVASGSKSTTTTTGTTTSVRPTLSTTTPTASTTPSTTTTIPIGSHTAPSGTPIVFEGSVRSSVPDPHQGNNVASISTLATLTTLDSSSEAVRTAFTSELEAVSTRDVVRGRVLIDQRRADSTDNRAPFLHQIQGNEGLHSVEGFLVSRMSGEGRWRFDFRNTKRYAPGSLQVESGDVISLDGASVVFRLSGAEGQRVKFTYRLTR